MKAVRELLMVLGMMMAATLSPAVAGELPGRNLTAEEAKELQQLTAESNGHVKAERFEDAARTARRIAAYRAEHQGERHWQTIDARLEVERWQRLADVPARDRADVVRGLQLNDEGQHWRGLGRYREAEGKLRQAVEALARVLGEHHPTTTDSRINLASALDSQGKHADALPLLRQALDARRRALGEQHSHTATACNNLALCLDHQGKHADALPLFRKALEAHRTALGEHHPDTAAGYNNLGLCLDRQGKHAEALPLLQKGLDIRRQVLGEQHPHTATSYNNVALCLNGLGRYVEAVPLYCKALAIRRQAHGDEHPSTATSYNNLALCLERQGRPAEALLLALKALAIRRRVLGEQHPVTAQSYNNVASCLDNQSKHAEALPLFRKALDIDRQVLGEEHPDTALSHNNVASCLNNQGKHAEALAEYQKALDIDRKVLGEQHPRMASDYNNAAACLDGLGRPADALLLFRKALTIRLQALGDRHPDTAGSYHNLALLLHRQGRHDEAITLFEKALGIKRTALGEQHAGTAISYSGLGCCLASQGKHAEAARAWEKALLGYEFGRLRAGSSGFDRSLFRDRFVSPRAALAATLVRLDQPMKAWEHAEADLARGLLDDLFPSDGIGDAARQSRLAAVEQVLLPLVATATLTPEESKRRDSLTKERDELLTELAREAVRRARERTLPLQEIQKHVPADAAIVFWLDVLDQHLGCVLRREGPPAWVALPGSGKEKEWTEADTALAERTRAAVADPSGEAEARQGLLARLYRQRLAPLEPHLKNVRLLLVVPAGIMAKVPVEALTDRYSVCYVPSASVHAHRMAQHRRLEATPVLVLADPVFTRAAPRWPPAPPHGLLVRVVPPGSLAARVGLVAGDVLLEYARTKLTVPDDLKPAAGDERVAIALWREGKTIQGRIPAGNLGIVVDKRPIGEALADWRRQQTSPLGTVRGDDWSALPGTRLEARALARLVPEADVLLGSDAAEQKLAELVASGRLKRYRLLHLATHGQVNAARPELTALILAQDRLPTPAEAEALAVDGKSPPEGKLTVARILAKDWQLDADLVVLSACQSGLGRETGGEGMVGFTQALLQKGARSVVLSRWKVDDAATALLMERFYQNLLGKRDGLKEGMKRAEALAEAKAWLRNLPRAEAEKRLAVLVDSVPRSERGSIKAALPTRKPDVPQDDRPFAHPYYWAAFVLIGDPQ